MYAEISTLLKHVILVFVVSFNASGVYLLRLAFRNSNNNQILILISLSVCNVTLAIFWTGDTIITHYNVTDTRIYFRWWSFLAGVYLVWYTMILLLTADRFIGCNFPIKHKLFVRRSIFLWAILICWFFGLTFAVIGCVLGSRYFRPWAKSYLWPTLDVLFLLMFVVTYASIFVVLARRRFGLQLAHYSNQTQFIVTVTAILVSFLCLEAVPTLVFAFHDLPVNGSEDDAK